MGQHSQQQKLEAGSSEKVFCGLQGEQILSVSRRNRGGSKVLVAQNTLTDDIQSVSDGSYSGLWRRGNRLFGRSTENDQLVIER